MINECKPPYLSLKEINERVDFYSGTFLLEELTPDLTENAPVKDDFISVEKDADDLSIKAGRVSKEDVYPLYQTLFFDDSECDLLAYFLNKYEYDHCTLSPFKGRTLVKIFHCPKEN